MKKYDCERLLSECGFSGSKSKKLASALRIAIDRQDKEKSNKKIKTIETINSNDNDNIKKKKRKNIINTNEINKREV